MKAGWLVCSSPLTQRRVQSGAKRRHRHSDSHTLNILTLTVRAAPAAIFSPAHESSGKKATLLNQERRAKATAACSNNYDA